MKDEPPKQWDVLAICQVTLHLGETTARTMEEAIEAFRDAELTAEKIASPIDVVEFTAVDRETPDARRRIDSEGRDVTDLPGL